LTRALAKAIPPSRDPYSEISVLGPVEAPLALLRGWYRWRFLVRASRRAPLQHFVRAWLKPVRIPTSARIGIDVDPQSFM
jgi:primosomal protein N' (replication factor Y)